MFRSAPVSSFFLFASPTSTPSPSNFNTINSRYRNGNNINRNKNTLAHKLINIALIINTLSLILCVCVIIVVIALTMTLNPNRTSFAFTSNNSNYNYNGGIIRHPTFIFTSVYPLMSKKIPSSNVPTVKPSAGNLTSSAGLKSSSSLSPSSSSYKSSSSSSNTGSNLYNGLLISRNLQEHIPSNANVDYVKNSKVSLPQEPILHPLPFLSTASPEIQALEQAYGQILAILPLFIISSLLGVSASAKSSTTGAIILYWIILTATLLISTYITSTFVEYENLFGITTSDLPKSKNLVNLNKTNVGRLKTLLQSQSTSETITDPGDEVIDDDDDDDFDDVYSDESDSDKESNDNSEVESVARIIVLIGALQMVSAIMLTFGKFHKTRVAIKDPSFNDLSRFNNPINMANIDGNNVIGSNASSSNRRLSSRGTIETSLQYYPDDGIDLINHSTASLPSMSLNHRAGGTTEGTEASTGNSTSNNIFQCSNASTSVSFNSEVSNGGNNNNNSNCNVVKTVYHEMHSENDQRRGSNSLIGNRGTRGYFITEGRSDLNGRINSFTNCSNNICANRVTFPEDILAIETVTLCDSTNSTNNVTSNNINSYNCNSNTKLNDSVQISIPENHSS